MVITEDGSGDSTTSESKYLDSSEEKENHDGGKKSLKEIEMGKEENDEEEDDDERKKRELHDKADSAWKKHKEQSHSIVVDLFHGQVHGHHDCSYLLGFVIAV